MQEVLNTLLERINDPTIRAAIVAGWELGKDLPPETSGANQFDKEIRRVAESMGRKMHLDADIISSTALLAMALSRHSL